MHRTASRFWQHFYDLPEAVQSIAKKNFELLKLNPAHPSLHFKKVGKFWPVRIGIEHRALAMEDGSDFIWLWIGKHDEYERMIG